MARVRKMVTLVSTTDDDYCAAASLRRKTTSEGKKLFHDRLRRLCGFPPAKNSVPHEGS
ncbi:MAG: hypothetical protein WCX63_08090 [Methanoregula sp.]